MPVNLYSFMQHSQRLTVRESLPAPTHQSKQKLEHTSEHTHTQNLSRHPAPTRNSHTYHVYHKFVLHSLFRFSAKRERKTNTLRARVCSRAYAIHLHNTLACMCGGGGWFLVVRVRVCACPLAGACLCVCYTHSTVLSQKQHSTKTIHTTTHTKKTHTDRRLCRNQLMQIRRSERARPRLGLRIRGNSDGVERGI